MKKWLWLLSTLIISGCLVRNNPENKNQNNLKQESVSIPNIELDNYGQAPELTNDTWLNTDQALRLADLRGKVVLLEMWTFG